MSLVGGCGLNGKFDVPVVTSAAAVPKSCGGWGEGEYHSFHSHFCYIQLPKNAVPYYSFACKRGHDDAVAESIRGWQGNHLVGRGCGRRCCRTVVRGASSVWMMV